MKKWHYVLGVLVLFGVGFFGFGYNINRESKSSSGFVASQTSNTKKEKSSEGKQSTDLSAKEVHSKEQSKDASERVEVDSSSQEEVERLEQDGVSNNSELVKSDSPLSQDVNDVLSSQPKGGAKYRLDVTQQVQRSWNTCAPTTVSMMLSSRGISVSQEVLARDMGTDETFGTHNADAIRVLNRHLFGYDYPSANQAGYRLATVTTSDPNSSEMKLFKERLKQNIKDGYPMYYTFDNARIYPGAKGEHNVIGIGYQLTEDGTDIAYVYYIDPSYTQQDPHYGGLKKVTPEELFFAMLTCVEPNYAW